MKWQKVSKNTLEQLILTVVFSALGIWLILTVQLIRLEPYLVELELACEADLSISAFNVPAGTPIQIIGTAHCTGPVMTRFAEQVAEGQYQEIARGTATTWMSQYIVQPGMSLICFQASDDNFNTWSGQCRPVFGK
jgi:hypothetical protein